MIVSHEHKFIFVHLKRTSGRAIQAALLPHLGPDDIYTPMRPTGNKPALPGQNHAGFERHMLAREIRERVGAKVWDEYFTFAMERNPWDKTLSRYWAFVNRENLHNTVYTKLKGKQMSFEHWLWTRRLRGRWLGKKHYHLPNHFKCYTDENGEPIVDVIARFEHRDAHLAEVSRRIGVPIDSGVKVGTSTRKHDKRPYTEYFDQPWMRELMESHFAPDLALLGYRFGEPAPEAWIEPAPLPS